MKRPSVLQAFILTAFLFGNLITVAHAQGGKSVSEWPRGVTYEIFVQSFADSDGDGIGDIKGMTSKLDYLEDLGVEGIWLMPINPSTSYHKYDVTNYYDIHPDYGTLEDFRNFVKEAHKRNIKVVMDLVLNHSSSKHAWFEDAVNNIDSPYRDFYVWKDKDDPETKAAGKIIAGDSNNTNRWNKVEGEEYLYYSYFGGYMPDLNYDNTELREEVYKIGRFWLTDVDVDGFRLDAARHIFPDDRPKDNHQWWIDFRKEMLKAKKEVYLVGEVWAPADVVAPYLEGLPALFNFEMSWEITKALKSGRGDSLAIKHAAITDYYKGVNPDFIDATILSNHDQNRIMSEVSGDLQKGKMAAALLLTLPGSPYLYYGEEIGMLGEKPDELIREPFLWNVKSKDENRTTWIEPENTTDASVEPLALQMKDSNSVFNHYKSFLQLRNNSKALTYGELEPVNFNKKEISAFIRSTEGESFLVLHNFSGSPVKISLPPNLKEYRNTVLQSKDAGINSNDLCMPGYSTLILKN